MRPHTPALLLALVGGPCILGVGACRPSDSALPTSGADPSWLVLRVDAVNVAPNRPGTSAAWDGPVPQPTDGAECGLLGLAGSIFVSPIAGKGVEYFCKMGSRPRQEERDPTAPDLIVALGAGPTANYQTYTARDSFYHVFHSEFVVPVDAIPPDGLLLTVLDRDGGQPEVISTLRLDRAQLVTAARSNPLLTLGDPRGALQRLELVVSALATPPESTTVPMNVRSGTTAASLRPVRAGEVVDISATGRYRIGSWNGAWIDPRGYPNGVARGYNFDNEPFRSAPHGSGLAMVGSADAKTGHSVAPCTRFVSRASGPLVLGINDTAPGNNEGSAQFAVHVRAPTVAEWLDGRTAPCLAR